MPIAHGTSTGQGEIHETKKFKHLKFISSFWTKVFWAIPKRKVVFPILGGLPKPNLNEMSDNSWKCIKISKVSKKEAVETSSMIHHCCHSFRHQSSSTPQSSSSTPDHHYDHDESSWWNNVTGGSPRFVATFNSQNSKSRSWKTASDKSQIRWIA